MSGPRPQPVKRNLATVALLGITGALGNLGGSVRSLFKAKTAYEDLRPLEDHWRPRRRRPRSRNYLEKRRKSAVSGQTRLTGEPLRIGYRLAAQMIPELEGHIFPPPKGSLPYRVKGRLRSYPIRVCPDGIIYPEGDSPEVKDEVLALAELENLI